MGLVTTFVLSGSRRICRGPSPGPSWVSQSISRFGYVRGIRDSAAREEIPSLPYTLCRWYSTVRGLMNNRLPMSALDSPSLAIRAIWASWAVNSGLGWSAVGAGVLTRGPQFPCAAFREPV